MPSRLPNWMKSAKNREMINKKLTQLQSQLDRYENKNTSKKSKEQVIQLIINNS